MTAYFKRLLARMLRLKPFRVYDAYSLAGGNLSAAGMSFQLFFAAFAAIWVGFSVSSFYMHEHQDVRDAVIAFINLQIPNFISPTGAIHPDSLSDTTLGWTGILALVVLAMTAINWIQYTRVAMHHMFGLPRPTLNFFLLKLWDLIIALIYGTVIFLAASLLVIATSFFSDVVKWLGLDQYLHDWTAIGVKLVIVVVVIAVDTVMPALMIRLLSGVAIPFRFLWRGALLGGIALGLLKVLGSALLTSTGHNPLFTTFAVFVAILVWFNIVCRIYLLTAEWIATSMRDAGITPAETGWVITRQGIKNRLKR